MDRRSFLSGVVPWAVAAAGAVATASGSTHRRMQPRVGFIDCHGAGGIDGLRVKKITVDGMEVDNVIELDDVEGWLRRYPDPIEIVGEDIQVERLEGEVEVFWKAVGQP